MITAFKSLWDWDLIHSTLKLISHIGPIFLWGTKDTEMKLLFSCLVYFLSETMNDGDQNNSNQWLQTHLPVGSGSIKTNVCGKLDPEHQIGPVPSQFLTVSVHGRNWDSRLFKSLTLCRCAHVHAYVYVCMWVCICVCTHANAGQCLMVGVFLSNCQLCVGGGVGGGVGACGQAWLKQVLTMFPRLISNSWQSSCLSLLTNQITALITIPRSIL